MDSNFKFNPLELELPLNSNLLGTTHFYFQHFSSHLSAKKLQVLIPDIILQSDFVDIPGPSLDQILLPDVSTKRNNKRRKSNSRVIRSKKTNKTSDKENPPALNISTNTIRTKRLRESPELEELQKNDLISKLTLLFSELDLDSPPFHISSAEIFNSVPIQIKFMDFAINQQISTFDQTLIENIYSNLEASETTDYQRRSLSSMDFSLPPSVKESIQVFWHEYFPGDITLSTDRIDIYGPGDFCKPHFSYPRPGLQGTVFISLFNSLVRGGFCLNTPDHRILPWNATQGSYTAISHDIKHFVNHVKGSSIKSTESSYLALLVVKIFNQNENENENETENEEENTLNPVVKSETDVSERIQVYSPEVMNLVTSLKKQVSTTFTLPLKRLTSLLASTSSFYPQSFGVLLDPDFPVVSDPFSITGANSIWIKAASMIFPKIYIVPVIITCRFELTTNNQGEIQETTLLTLVNLNSASSFNLPVALKDEYFRFFAFGNSLGTPCGKTQSTKTKNGGSTVQIFEIKHSRVAILYSQK